MNIYYCDTCGARITDSEQQESGNGPRYCEKHRPAPVEKLTVASRPNPSKSRITPVQRNSGTHARPKVESSAQAASKSKNAIALAAAAGIFAAMVFLIFVLGRSEPAIKEAASLTPQNPQPVQKTAEAHSPPHVDLKEVIPVAESKPAPSPVVVQSPATTPEQNDLSEIRESAARRELEQIAALERAPDANMAAVRKRYTDFIASSYHGTKAAAEAEEHLKQMPELAETAPATQTKPATNHIDLPETPAVGIPPTSELSLSQSDGLMAHYTFGEGSGNSTEDRSGNGCNATLKKTSWTTGKAGGGIEFNGKDSSVVVEEAKDTGGPFTLAVWAKIDTPHEMFVITRRSRHDEKSLSYCLRFENDGAVRTGFRTGPKGEAIFIRSKLRCNDKQWHHLAGAYDGKTVALYIDGKQEAAAVADRKPCTAANSTLMVGGDPVYGSPFKGILSDVRIYSRALSAAEIAALATSADSASGEQPKK